MSEPTASADSNATPLTELGDSKASPATETRDSNAAQSSGPKTDPSNEAFERDIKIRDLKYKRIELLWIKPIGLFFTVLAICFAGCQVQLLSRQMENTEKASQNIQAHENEIREAEKATRRNELLMKLYAFDDAIHKDLLQTDPIVTKLLFHDPSGELYHKVRKDYNAASAPSELLLPPDGKGVSTAPLRNATTYARLYSFSDRYGDMFELFAMLKRDPTNPIEEVFRTSWERCIDDQCKSSYGFVHCMYESRNAWSKELIDNYFVQHFRRLSQEDKDMADKPKK